MHAYAHPEHERQAAELARALGFAQVSASHEVSPLIKLVPRGDTTVADAYLSPVLRRYIDRVSAALSFRQPMSPNLLFMASSGGLKAAQTFRGRDAILSGPAGGVVGMAETGKRAGFDPRHRLRHGWHVDRRRALRRRVRALVRDADRRRAHRRPDAARAYGGGGRRLDHRLRRHALSRRPGERRRQPGAESLSPRRPADRHRRQRHARQARCAVLSEDLRAGARSTARRRSGARAFADLAREVGDGRTPEEIADGAIRIAVENMANAIKKISVERGYDVTEYALNCFGSAGGQHACLIADTLGIETVLVHPLSGLLSAYGMGLAQQRASRERSIEAPLDGATMRELESLAYELGSAATEELLDQGVEHDAIAIESFVHLRYAGTDTALAVPLSEPGFMRRDFEALHRQRFGFISPEKDIVAAAIEVAAASGESDGEGEVDATPHATAGAMAPTAARGSIRAGAGTRRRSSCARRSHPARSSPARRWSSSRTRPSSSSPAGS